MTDNDLFTNLQMNEDLVRRRHDDTSHVAPSSPPSSPSPTTMPAWYWPPPPMGMPTSPVSMPRRVLSYDDDGDENLRPRTSTPVRRHRRRNAIARMDLVTALTDLSNTTYWLATQVAENRVRH